MAVGTLVSKGGWGYAAAAPEYDSTAGGPLLQLRHYSTNAMFEGKGVFFFSFFAGTKKCISEGVFYAIIVLHASPQLTTTPVYTSNGAGRLTEALKRMRVKIPSEWK
jgi:hypothetical protein